jgi:hypothetical protein
MVVLLSNWFPFVLAGAASLFGLWAFVTGRFNLGQGWHVEATKARILGLLLVPTLPVLLGRATPPFSVEVLERDMELRRERLELDDKLTKARDAEWARLKERMEKARQPAKESPPPPPVKPADGKKFTIEELLRVSAERAKESEEKAKVRWAEWARQQAEDEKLRQEKQAEIQGMERDLASIDDELRSLDRPPPDQLKAIFNGPILWVVLVLGLSWLLGVKTPAPGEAAAAPAPATENPKPGS